MTDTRTFMAAVAEKFGEYWRVEERPGGFAAILDLSRRPTAPVSGSAEADAHVITVTVDDATGVFSFDSGRAADSTRETETKRLGHYSKSFDASSYRGKRMAFTFKRTPDGLVPDTSDPFNTVAREQELAEIGQSLGLTLDASRPTPLSLRVSKMPSKRMMIAVLVGFGVVFLGIVAIVVTIFASVLGSIAG